MSSENRFRTLSFRFDIDGIGDIERGIPRLLSLADSLGVKFSFYVNMGTSVNLKIFFINLIKKVLRKENYYNGDKNGKVGNSSALLSKHGFIGIIKTVLCNPYIGVRYKKDLHKVQGKGHELGLHGGMDHALWLYDLENLDPKKLEDLLLSAYKRFERFYGKPYGFCSPGLKYNDKVLDLVNKFQFLYISEKVQFEIDNEWNFYSVPVNVMGQDDRSLISYGLLQGWTEEYIEREIIRRIKEGKEPAVYYGHPSVEGLKGVDILRNVIKSLKQEGYRVVTLKELVSIKMEKIYEK